MTQKEPSSNENPDEPDTFFKNGSEPSGQAVPDTIIGPSGRLVDTSASKKNDASSLFLSPLNRTIGSGEDSSPELPPLENAGVHLGEYQLLSEIARGGMGIVFKARHRKLNRIVALKVTRSDKQSPEEESFRFLAEAEAAAKLDHPNIVPIYEVGEDGGRLFFSMAYVEGKSLAQLVRASPLTPRRAVELIKQVADAVSYAHSNGVIHRDLKPGNILVDGKGLPRITDFGVAKRTDVESGLTRDGQIMGTPSYMSPEQAGGKNDQVGPLADVYSLGATLYFLLVGRPPFQAGSVIDTLRQVEDLEPVPPRVLSRSVDRDLDTICLKCLEKRPEQRYASAAELSADLERFLQGQAIHARPVGTFGKLTRWGRRNPAIATLVGLVAFGLVATTIASLLTLNHILGINEDLVDAKNLANQNALNEKMQRRRADDQARETRRQLERLYSEKGLDLADNRDLSGALLWWTQPFSDQHGTVERPESTLKRLSLYWRYSPSSALEQIFMVQSPCWFATFNPKGDRFAAGGEDGQIRIWDVSTGETVLPPLDHVANIRHLAFSPDGTFLVSSSWGQGVRVWDTATGKLIKDLLGKKHIENTAISPDGKRVISAGAGKDVSIFSTETWQPISKELPHKRELSFVAFSRDGTKIVTASWDGTARVWDGFTGDPVTPPLSHETHGVTWAEFSPDGKLVVTACWDKKARIWDVASGKLISTMASHKSQLRQASFHPGGRLLVTASEDGTAMVWEVATGRSVTPPLQHQSVVWRAVFSPSGGQVATASRDGTARLWDTATGQSIAIFRNQRAVRHVQFSRDGKDLIVASEDGTVKLWQLDREISQGPRIGHLADLQDASFSPDGKWILTASRDGKARVWDSDTGKPVSNWMGHQSWIRNASFSPDGRMVLTASTDGTARVWESETGKPIGQPMVHSREVRYASFSLDSRKVVTAGMDESAKIWNAQTGQLIFKLDHASQVWYAVFSNNGEKVATGTTTGEVAIWDCASGKCLAQVTRHKLIVSCLAFSPDDRFLLSASEDGNARVSEIATGKTLPQEFRHGAAILHASFRQDGRWVLTSSQDGSAQIWETATGRPVSPAMAHRGTVFRAVFSPDGKWVSTASADGTMRVWEAASGQAVSPPLVHGSGVVCVNFNPAGNRVVTASFDGRARSWDVTTDSRSPSQWMRLGELLCGHRLNYQGAMIPVDLKDLESSMASFRKDYPAEFGAVKAK